MSVRPIDWADEKFLHWIRIGGSDATWAMLVPHGFILSQENKGDDNMALAYIPCTASEARRWIEERWNG